MSIGPPNWFDRLDPELRAAVEFYQNGGYKDINLYLRRRASGEPMPKHFGIKGTNEVRRQIDALAAAFSEAPELEAATTVYRGIKHWPHGRPEVGDEFRLEGFTSTSLVPDQASRFVGQPDWILLQLSIPIGTRALWLGALRGPFEHQQEFLLPHETRIVIDAVVDADYLFAPRPTRLVYECEVILDE